MLIVLENEFIAEIKYATNQAFLELFSNGENFYYCSLITTGEALAPVITAWSYQALDRVIKKNQYNQEDTDNIKWSYSESPYFNFGEKYFKKVNELFNKRPKMDVEMDVDNWEQEFEFRLNAMEKAMQQLDMEGIFALNQSRSDIVINVETMPPDYQNTLRAMRLNPPNALTEWLLNVAEIE